MALENLRLHGKLRAPTGVGSSDLVGRRDHLEGSSVMGHGKNGIITVNNATQTRSTKTKKEYAATICVRCASNPPLAENQIAMKSDGNGTP